MAKAERFRNVSLVLAVASTVLYWSVYADNGRVAAERRTARVATAMPIPLNGFKPSLLGVSLAAGQAWQTEVGDQDSPRLLIVVSDTCPGSGVAVPQWVDWIGSSANRGYSAVVVSIEGGNYLSQITDAFASRGVDAVALQVTQLQQFMLSSGVSVTPALLAMDRRGQVRFVGGMFSQATRRALDAFLDLEEKALVTN